MAGIDGLPGKLQHQQGARVQLPLSQVLAQRVASPAACPAGRFEGRGIVICAGGLRYFTCAFVLIRVIRGVLKSRLPIQVWHLGQREMSAAMRRILEEEDVEVIDAEAVIARHPARVAGGWPLKPYAVAHSHFREVLLLDADTVPLQALDGVFDWPQYRATGLLFWPDCVDLTSENPVWQAVGLEPRSCVSFETGLFVLDKARAFDVLDLGIAMNERWEELYSLIHGEKDSFLLACLLLGRDFGLIAHRPFALDSDLVQRSPDGEPFVHHRTYSKWCLERQNRPVSDPRMTHACEEALAELRRRWTGAIFHPPARGAAALEAERRLVAAGRFTYETTTTAARSMTFEPGWQVGEGRAEFEQHWAVVEDGAGLVLKLYSASCLCVELRPLADGSWHGGSLADPRFGARLVGIAAGKTWPHAGSERLSRSCAAAIEAVLAPDILGSGFEEGVAEQLAAALTLLNRVSDDVPEQLAARVEGAGVPDGSWRDRLARLAAELRRARDERIALATPVKIPVLRIDPHHYRRVG
jgi:hypothetical protein